MQNSIFLVQKLAQDKDSSSTLFLEIFTDYYLSPGVTPSNIWREQYTRILLKENLIKDLVEKKIRLDAKQPLYFERMSELLAERQKVIDYNLETMEEDYLASKKNDEIKKRLLTKLNEYNRDHLCPNKKMDNSSGEVFRTSLNEVTIYPCTKTLHEKYEALCKAFDKCMELDSLVRFSCASSYSLLPATVSYPRDDDAPYIMSRMGLCVLDRASGYTIDQYLSAILGMQKENRALEEESLFAYKCKVSLLVTELDVELCIRLLNWTLLKIEEKVESQYLDHKITEHESLGYLIESSKMDIHERTVALKRLESQRAKSSYAQFETELLKIGLDSKIAEHESLANWIESGKMHLHEVSTELNALNLEASEIQ
jgi:hypothetical protein